MALIQEVRVKQPDEVLDYDFIFDELEADETLLSSTVELVWPTTDLTLGSKEELFSVGIVKQWIEDGLDGVRYRVRCLGVSDKGRTMELDIIVPVKSKAKAPA